MSTSIPSPVAAFDPAAAIAGPIAPVRKSPLYGVGLLLVALLMIALPLIYLGLIAAAAYAVYWHATQDLHWLTEMGGRNSGSTKARLFGYVAPIVVGLVCIFFMLKPLFAPRRHGFDGMRALPEDHPRLFAFVEHLCRAVGAPVPREIWLDCEVNASAGLRRGFASFLSHDLRLTIGLPLVAGLDLRQLAGVLAHEFGHFAQGAGMRLSYVIKRINAWFARVVYERDAWDDRLAQARETGVAAVIVMAMLAQLAVWLTRRVLWVLMLLGGLVSGFVSRQMEYDADRYEARLAGSATFAATSARLHLLGAGRAAAQKAEWRAWQDRRLPDDLPALVTAQAAAFPAAARAQIEQHSLAQRAGWFDTHPATADRVRSAEREQAPGLIRYDGPAGVLFADFPAVCRTLTFVYYRDMIGDEFDRKNLVPTETLLGELQRARAESAGVAELFGAPPLRARPYRPAIGDPAGLELRAAAAELRAARQELARLRPALSAVQERLPANAERLDHLAAAEVLLTHKVRVAAGDFGLRHGRLDELEPLRSAARAACEQDAAILAEVDAAAGRRLRAALRLLGAPQVAARLEGAADLAREAARLGEVLALIDPVLRELPELRRVGLSAAHACAALANASGNVGLESAARSRLGQLQGRLRELRRDLDGHDYPFPHASGRLSIGQYLLDSPPVSDAPDLLLPAAGTFFEQLETLYDRTLSRLAAIALSVERALQAAAREQRAAQAGSAPAE